MKRRKFLGGVGCGLLATTLSARFATASQQTTAARPLRLLILGGTRFIGLHMTELALSRGHTVTFFNRGRTNTERFPQVERLRGDRNGDISALAGREWDAVIDNSGYVPRQVREAATLLEPRVHRYLFISSVSVYAGFEKANDEASPVGKLEDPNTEKVDGATYGPLKAACESAAEAVYGSARTTVIRPGLIVGPDDNTDRFTYWPARAARGGRMLAPGEPGDPIQIIDVRDLAAFTLRLLELDSGGVFNVLSPPGRFNIGGLVGESIAAAKALANPPQPPVAQWVPAATLAANEVAPWSDMPVWVPPGDGQDGFAATAAERALRAGLTIRPLGETVRDTLRWHLSRPEAERAKLRSGIDAQREAAVLAAFDARAGAAA